MREAMSFVKHINKEVTMISVTVTDKDGVTTTSTFDKVDIMIGRLKDKSNDIVLWAENVQRHHARIVWHDNHLILIHLNCRDTFVNGHKILNPYVLHEGDKIVIGDFTLKVDLVVEPEVAPAKTDATIPKLDPRELARTLPCGSSVDRK